MLMSTVVPFTAKVLPEPIKLRVVKPNPMVPPEVLIPTQTEAVTTPMNRHQRTVMRLQHLLQQHRH